MPSALVSVAEAMVFLGTEDPTDEKLVESLVDAVEAGFLAETNRRERPFQAAQTGRAELRNGTGTASLWLDYPVDSLTTVKLGPVAATPNETLDVSDVNVIRWTPGRRRIDRVDGGTFGACDDPNVVRVTYNAAADLPLSVRVAVLRVVAAIFHRRGSEDVSSERNAGVSLDYAAVAESDDFWKRTVAAHWEPRV